MHSPVFSADIKEVESGLPSADGQRLAGGDWWNLLLWALPLAFLWWRLIDHLRVEWSVNPQYTYGWAVPFLCVYLVWRRVRNARNGSVDSPAIRHVSSRPVSRSSILLLFAVSLAFLYLPTRLIQEANPEWRFVSWALAFIVVGATLLFLRFKAAIISPVNPSVSRSANLVFPILFFLVAVPWPTLIEAPLIQTLARANAVITTEVVGWIGVPAIRHGNVIEIGSGMVGVDDACSGIRSFQAALMISLFLGEVCQLTVPRRVWLCFSGFGLSFLFNLIRTAVLVTVAAKKGIGAIASWHDPAGVTILVGCFVGVWLIAIAFKKRTRDQRIEDANGKIPSTVSCVADPNDEPPLPASLRLFGVMLLFWIVLVEVGTEAWYRIHERNLPLPVTWKATLPRDNPSFRELPISETTRQFLRCDEGVNGAWNEPDATRWQAIFLRWDAGRIAPHLAKNHTPEICLAASGREILSVSGLQWLAVHGLELPFRSYRVKEGSGTLHVFYCLWEDRAVDRAFGPTTLSYGNRLEPVLTGRRHSGQRSLEVVIWGVADAAEAQRALVRQLERLVQADPR